MPAPRPLDEVQARTSFARFRMAAFVEGIALLVLVTIMVMRYLVTDNSPTWASISGGWSPIHGVIYMIYVIFSFDLWIKMRWPWPRMLLLMFFGVIPVLSFFGEKWTKAQMETDLRHRPTIQDEEGSAGSGGAGPERSPGA